MKQSIVIGAYHGNAEALSLLLTSLVGVKWPVLVVVSGSGMAPLEWLNNLFWRCREHDWQVMANVEDVYELGAFVTVLQETDLDEFLFLQDTFEVLDQGFIDVVMASSHSVALGPDFFHYAGKWKRSVLDTMDIPVVRSKRESVFWEHTFSRAYREREQVVVLDPDFHDGAHKGFVEMFGRQNMLLENRWYRKRKADWGQRIL